MNRASEVLVLPNGSWKQNCYIIYNNYGEALIIDPGSDDDLITDTISKQSLKPLAILNTHAHFDHIGGVSALIDRYNIPFFLHSDDKKLLFRANMYSSIFDAKGPIKIPKKFEDLKNLESKFNLSGFNIVVINTPGHTDGSVCYLIDGVCMVGDTLFYNDVGRVDLPGGNAFKLQCSLKNIATLPKDTVIYPGHGRSCTLSEVFKSNIKFKQAAGFN